MKYSREYFADKVLIVRRLEQLQIVLKDLETTADISTITTEFPSIIYQAQHKSIDISGISEENLLKLKSDKDFGRRIIELR